MTPAERDLDKLMEECRVYIKVMTEYKVGGAGPWTPPDNPFAIILNAFPAGARARLEMVAAGSDYAYAVNTGVGFMELFDKWCQASRLVSECDALQKGEGA